MFPYHIDSSGPDVNSRLTSKTPSYMSRAFSGPTISDSRDRPMTLSEVHVAAEYALKLTVSDPDLLNSLASVEEFEVLNQLVLLWCQFFTFIML